MRKALTDALVRNIAPPSTGRVEVADLREPGLSFRVTANGARSWCFRFRDPRTGKSTRATIGHYPDVPLGKARKRADAMRKEVATGTIRWSASGTSVRQRQARRSGARPPLS